MKKKLSIKKADILIICAVLFSAGCLFLFTTSDGPSQAEIIVDGAIIHTVNLSSEKETRTIDLDNGVIIEVSENSIYFKQSDCNGKDCIACGRLSSPGDMAVCIPNKTIIKLTGKQNGSPDAVSY